MRVRNLKQYIESIPGSGYNISELGTHREPFLTYMGGHYQNIDQVKKFIESSSSFATNAEEQLFYEFVQNAYDAQADSLFFFANNDYLIVLNNGRPFYTDYDIQAEDRKAGQLYNFLAKGKSDKSGDDDQMGQYGQGSKLLYTLITNVPESSEFTDAELLVRAIYYEKRGPYLISWNSQEQLTSILYGDKNWELAQADDYKNNILFAKILYSYFPIAPSQEPNLFGDEEAKKIVDVFDKLVDPRRNLQFLNSGTSLIIPLGKGKFDLINSSTNLSRVRTRLGGFSALTSDQDERKGLKLKHIYVLGQEIEQTEVKSIKWEKKQGAKTYKYHLAFNPIFAQEGYVNIFKGLPILSTKHHLGFIIDSQCFQTDDSRQRLSNPQTFSMQLKDIFEELVKRLKKIKETDEKTYDWIYDSIIASRISKDEDSQFLQDPFCDVIKPYLADNVRTSTHSYTPSANVYTHVVKYGFDIPLAQLGIASKNWVDESIIKSLSYIGVSLGKLELSDVINEANKSAYKQWVKVMPDSDYELYQNFCWSYVQSGIHTSVQLFRSDKKNLYSLETLNSDSPIYYGFEQNMFNGLEHIQFPFSGEPTYSYFTLLLNKINKNIGSYRSSSVLKDTICALLRYIVNNNSSLKKEVLSNVFLFENQLGTLSAFSNLFVDIPRDTILFDAFQVKGYLPESIKTAEWMINAKNNPQLAWNWVVSNISSIIDIPDWDSYAHDYLRDLKDLYNSSSPTETTPLITNLYIDNTGKATSKVYAIVQGAKKFSADDYDLIQSIFPNESLLPFEFYKDLNDKPFDLTKITVNDLMEDGLCVSLDELSVLNRYVSVLLKKYYIKELNGKFVLNTLGKGSNYINELDENMNSLLEYNDFHYIPKSVQSVFSISELASCDIAKDATLMQSIVINTDDNNLLSILPLVEKSDASILRTYFQRLTTINIDRKLTVTDYEWRVIKLAVMYKSNTDFIDIIFNKIRHKGSKLEDQIVQEIVKVGDKEYLLFDLDINYKISNDHIDSFLNCLPSPNDADSFKKEYYKGKQTYVSAANVYNKIHTLALSLEQLRFCIDYSKNSNLSGVRFCTEQKVTITQVMDMVEANGIREFDKYYTLPNFNASQQVYADSDLLLSKEQLPYELKKWLDCHHDSTSWFSSIRTASEAYIAVRAAIHNKEQYNGGLNDFAIDNMRTHDAVEWLLGQNIVCASNSDEHKLLSDIIRILPESFSVMPLFKFTGSTVTDVNDNFPNCLFTFCAYVSGKPFLRVNDRAFAESLEDDLKLQQFIKQSFVFEDPSSDTLRKHKLHTAPRWEVKNGVSNGKYEELSYTKYKEWKNNAKDSQGITLWTSKNPVGVTLYIEDSNKKELFSIKRANAEYGYSYATKQVVVQWPNKENLSKIDTISKYSKNIYWLKDPLIALLKLYVNETDELQQLAEENGMEVKDIVEMVRNTLSGSSVDKTVLSAVQKSPELFKTMVADIDESTLKKISENTTLVKSLINIYSDKNLQWMADLSKNTIIALKKLGKNNLEKLMENSSNFDELTKLLELGVESDDAELLKDFVDALGCNDNEELRNQLDAIKDAYQHFDKVNWEKLSSSAEEIADILETFDEEEIKRIAKNKENLKEFLQELEQENENEDRDSSIGEIIGYIGELIYEQYLLKKGIKYEFSAEKGVGEYDFITYAPNSTKERYIDVKTTRNTLSDGHSPLYIHKSQDAFLRSNVGITYRFVRISLHDLEGELESEYERFRDEYGNIDPRKNNKLKKECRDLAKRYWSQADINEFQNSSPEYRIEFVNR